MIESAFFPIMASEDVKSSESLEPANSKSDRSPSGSRDQDSFENGRPPASISSTQDTPTLSGSTVRNSSLEHITKPRDEQSPLLSPVNDFEDDEERGLVDDQTVLDDDYDEFQETKSVWYLILLTMSIGGLQIAWSVELSNGSPYLLSLGLSKSLMALVWIAGPLSGSLVQPYIGIRSDNSRLKFGKRRPFMLVGAFATILSLLALAWTREIVGGFLGWFGASADSQVVKSSIIVVAVMFVYVLDFSINTVQAAIRAFMVDCAPTHQQEAANAWAGRITGVGNILGYIFGYIDLPKVMWFFGDTQFKVLCVIASIALGSTVVLSSALIKERDPRYEDTPINEKGGVIVFFKQVFSSIKRLPPQTRKVCEVQFFAWIGWFPFLFYITTYIGELYVQPYFEANPNLSSEEIDALYAKATRIGTFALLVYAIVSFLSNLLLPLIVAPTFDIAPSSSSTYSGKSSTVAARMSSMLDCLVIPWLTLSRAWMLSLIMFAVCMWMTLFVRTATAGTIIVGLVGLPWAMTLWAPFALISAEISKRDALRRSRRLTREESDGSEENLDDQAGIILGLHNVAIASPQIIATVGSSLLFKLLQKPRGTPGDNSVGWVLRVGGLAALVAAYMASRIDEEKDVVQALQQDPVDDEQAVPGRGGRASLTLPRRSSSSGGLLDYHRVE